jgi:hypothetical protein
MLLDLSVQSDTTPSSLLLTRIYPSTNTTIGSGAHADVFQGTYEDQPVALKRLRVFLQTPDPSAYHKVRCQLRVAVCSTHQLLGFLPGSLTMASAPTCARSTIFGTGCGLSGTLLMYGVAVYDGGQCAAICEDPQAKY